MEKKLYMYIHIKLLSQCKDNVYHCVTIFYHTSIVRYLPHNQMKNIIDFTRPKQYLGASLRYCLHFEK
jgi:hypothetical protein